jgi:hypothetical protein
MKLIRAADDARPDTAPKNKGGRLSGQRVAPSFNFVTTFGHIFLKSLRTVCSGRTGITQLCSLQHAESYPIAAMASPALPRQNGASGTGVPRGKQAGIWRED